MTTGNGDRRRASWRLVLHLPDGYAEDTAALFKWLRKDLIPAVLNAPIRITLELKVPEEYTPDEE